MTQVVYEGTWTREDRQQDLYRSLPFDVIAGTAEVNVELTYDKGTGRALDIGLFDPAGFRGWSGSSRSSVVLREGAATPGYIAGPLREGPWHVEMGLHRIPAEGLPYRLTVTTSDSPVKDDGLQAATHTPAGLVKPPRPRRELPALPGHRWFAGDFHVHSHHSDGTESVAELAARALAAGLDFLAITDFNTTSHYREIDALRGNGKLLLIGGQTVALDSGHTVVLGEGPWVDLRQDPTEWAARARAEGRLLIANNPVKPDGAWRIPVPFAPDLAEIWTGGWDGRNGAPLAWWAAGGTRISAVGGSDWHGPAAGRAIASPTTWVQAERDDVMGGLATGKTAVSAAIDGPVILRVGDEIVAMDAVGLELVNWTGNATRVNMPEQHFAAESTPYLLRDEDERVVAIAS